MVGLRITFWMKFQTVSVCVCMKILDVDNLSHKEFDKLGSFWSSQLLSFLHYIK